MNRFNMSRFCCACFICQFILFHHHPSFFSLSASFFLWLLLKYFKRNPDLLSFYPHILSKSASANSGHVS